MKIRQKVVFAAVGLIACLTQTNWANLVAFEPFDLAVENLDGAGSGEGWAGDWVAVDGAGLRLSSDRKSLAYPLGSKHASTGSRVDDGNFTDIGYEIHVSDFGAFPDNGSDAGPGIKEAVNVAVRAGGPRKVVFATGTYMIEASSIVDAFLRVENRDGLTFEGEDTLLVLKDSPRASAFVFENCRNLTVRGLALDHAPVPYSQGRIVAVDGDAGTFDLAIDEGYQPLSNSELLSVGSTVGYVYEDNGDFKKMADKIWQADIYNWEPIGDQLYRITMNRQKVRSSLEPGNRVALKDRGGVMVNVRNSEDVLFEDVAIYAAGGIGIVGHKSDGLRFNRVAIERKPNTDRLFSVNNAAIRVDSARRGPIIENSRFEGTGDDTLVFVGYPAQITEVISDTEVIASHRNFRLDIGDTVEVWASDRGIIRGAAVAEVVVETGNTFRIKFDRPIPGITDGNDGRQPDRIFNADTMLQGTIVRDSFGSNLARIFVAIFGATEVMVSNNHVEKAQGPAVSIRGSRHGAVGVSRNVTIQDNRFEATYFPYSLTFGGFAINTYLGADGSDTGAESRAIENLVIENNTFIDPGRGALWLSNVANVEIRRNKIQALNTTPAYDGTGRGIWLENGTGIVIDGLELIDPRPDITAGIVIEANVGTVELGELSFDLAPGNQEIVDHRNPN